MTFAGREARVAGVDLAAEAAGTALAVLNVSGAAVALESLQLGVDDETIVRATRDVELIGIDCAFGWPRDFVDFVSRHSAAVEPRAAAGGVQPAGPTAALAGASDPTVLPATGDLAWRRRLAFRETDRVVTELTGARPLSVATDRLGMTALRCAVLLQRIRADGRVVDRSGEHPSAVVEVYPAMALRVWGIARPGYKAATDARLALIADLERAAPWLGLGEHRALMATSADALDAVLAALVALAHGRGASIRPEPHQRALAEVEGWIAIPTVSIDQLGAVG
jgi:predicted nuclease with RNAse H fold